MISNLVHLHETQQQAVKYVFNLQRNCILYYAAQTAWPLKRGLQESHLVTEYEVQAVGPGWENTRALSNTHCMYSLKVIGHLEKKKKYHIADWYQHEHWTFRQDGKQVRHVSMASSDAPLLFPSAAGTGFSATGTKGAVFPALCLPFLFHPIVRDQHPYTCSSAVYKAVSPPLEGDAAQASGSNTHLVMAVLVKRVVCGPQKQHAQLQHRNKPMQQLESSAYRKLSRAKISLGFIE